MNRILVDGYNLLFYFEDQLSDVERGRQSLLSSLNELLAQNKTEILFVFDSSTGNASYFEYYESLKVVFSPINMSADHYILEILQGVKYPGNVTVVTSDKILARKARDLGGETKSISSFIKWISKKRPNLEKSPSNSSVEQKRYRKIFEKRWQDQK